MALYYIEVINTDTKDVYPFVGKSSMEVAKKFDSRVKYGAINGVVFNKVNILLEGIVMLNRDANSNWK